MAEQKFDGILSKQKCGIARPVKEGEDPWQCDVHKEEIVVEYLSMKDLLLTTHHTIINCILSLMLLYTLLLLMFFHYMELIC